MYNARIMRLAGIIISLVVLGLSWWFLWPHDDAPKAIPVQQDPVTGFVVGGKNETALIRKLTQINGRSIAALEKDMRPGALSEAGFLGPDEKLLEVMVADNQFVVEEMGLTHQELAKHLRNVATKADRRRREEVTFRYQGRRFKIKIMEWDGSQDSPFKDGTWTSMDAIVWNLDNETWLEFSLLLPEIIERYGFYEGHGTKYRVDPRKVMEVFDFLSAGPAPQPARIPMSFCAGAALAASIMFLALFVWRKDRQPTSPNSPHPAWLSHLMILGLGSSRKAPLMRVVGVLVSLIVLGLSWWFLWPREGSSRATRVHQDPVTGFLVGGKNETALIKQLTQINGRSIAALEEDMRRGALTDEGFLGLGEKLLEVMAADNEFVVDEMGLTHQELARHLRNAAAMAIGRRDRGLVSFPYQGRRFQITIMEWKNWQDSPFNDGTRTTRADAFVWNLDNGKSLGFSLLVLEMIERYGFYEGHGTKYRVDPRKVIEVFDFLKAGPAPPPRPFPTSFCAGAAVAALIMFLALFVGRRKRSTAA